ncbi:FdtA/QdtA family cupin domain-containing protein [Entomomonas sp. E2T0]|uniref:sugar 3,4-ketoisomerase n=1 Tax=Entomomonas sp. E2T0 TaxID=2930213 RepID=UPI0022281831|nr:FdtA/QdtA family cupin domain-containing protein [Entomomonas sp. E2T0]UYZ82831.1 FdtA/QdtA family cupin domain-containing protein [Entomomonas sp. E2T0]
MDYKIIDFKIRGDERGSLVAIDGNQDIPFDIKRVYYVFGTNKDVVRGKHAHKNLEQIIICTSGACDFILDDGKKRETIHLDKPNKGLYIANSIWREFTNFSSDCVVMVLASQKYDEADYIKDYQQFLSEVNK